MMIVITTFLFCFLSTPVLKYAHVSMVQQRVHGSLSQFQLARKRSFQSYVINLNVKVHKKVPALKEITVHE